MENHRTSTYEYGTVSIVVHRPGLSPEEESKQHRQIMTALQLYGKEQAIEKVGCALRAVHGSVPPGREAAN